MANTTLTESVSSSTDVEIIARCRFLELPRELRDNIYNYTLTYDEGLVCVHKPFELSPTSPLIRGVQQGQLVEGDANPFRSVCTQMRAETQHLVLKLNPIVFDAIRLLRPGNMFQKFSGECSTSAQALLRRAVIVPDGRLGLGGLFDIMSKFRVFALRNPHVMIFVSVPAPFMDIDEPSEWIRWIASYQQCFRGKTAIVITPGTGPVEDNLLEDPNSRDRYYFPQNVRVAIVEEFPVEDVVECYQSMGLSEGEVERAVEKLRLVFREGM